MPSLVRGLFIMHNNEGEWVEAHGQYYYISYNDDVQEDEEPDSSTVTENIDIPF